MDTGLLAGIAIGVVVIATTGFTIIDRRRSKSLREFKDRRERLRDAIMPEVRRLHIIGEPVDDDVYAQMARKMEMRRHIDGRRFEGKRPELAAPYGRTPPTYPYVADDGTVMTSATTGYNFGTVNIPTTEFAKAREHGWQAAGGDLAGTTTTVYRDKHRYEANRQRLEIEKVARELPSHEALIAGGARWDGMDGYDFTMPPLGDDAYPTPGNFDVLREQIERQEAVAVSPYLQYFRQNGGQIAEVTSETPACDCGFVNWHHTAECAMYRHAKSRIDAALVERDDEGEPLAAPPAPNLGGEGNPDYRGPHYDSLLEGQAAAWAPYEMLHKPPEGAAVYAIGEHHYVQPEGENDGTPTDRDPA